MPPIRHALAGSWLESRRFWELVAALSIVATAATLRLERLDEIPYGISGDEATFGLEGRRILDEGWIGPYSPLAAGQPTGVFYLGAVSLRLFGETIFALRLVPAVAGILTVVALYLVARRSFGVGAALLGAGLLAVSSWHIHFSRFAVPLVVWPLVALLTFGALVEALERQSLRWWCAAGVFAGLGVYVYDANTILSAVVFLAVAAIAFLRRVRLRRVAAGLAVAAAAFALVALPMLVYVAEHTDEYLGHARYNTIFKQPGWQARHGAASRVSFLAHRYVTYWNRLCCEPRVDGVDATGRVALLPPAVLLLTGYGTLVALIRRRHAVAVILALAIVLVLPVAAVISEGGGARRALATLPLVAMLAGVGAADLVGRVRRLLGASRLVASGALAAALLLVAYQGVEGYFDELPGSPEEEFVFARPITDASFFMRRLPPDRHVYFSSSAASVTHEIRRFLAPRVVAEDRSREFGGNPSFDVVGDGLVPVFLLFDTYQAEAPRLRRLYPGGRTVIVPGRAGPEFVAYLLPRPPPEPAG